MRHVGVWRSQFLVVRCGLRFVRRALSFVVVYCLLKRFVGRCLLVWFAACCLLCVVKRLLFDRCWRLVVVLFRRGCFLVGCGVLIAGVVSCLLSFSFLCLRLSSSFVVFVCWCVLIVGSCR